MEYVKSYSLTVKGKAVKVDRGTDDNGNEHLVVDIGGKQSRYSPNYTKEELELALNSDGYTQHEGRKFLEAKHG